MTDGNHQENVLCEANVCYVPGSSEKPRPGEQPCSSDDLNLVGPAGGMRCTHTPITLSVPPTPAEKCEGKFTTYADIPGFHDPRIFWSGKGEPLMMVNTQYALIPPSSAIYSDFIILIAYRSRYACFGLWVVDLRTLYSPLQTLLASSPTHFSLGGPLKSYPTLTEFTRNPANTRSPVEKNWMLFFPSNGEAYIHYDLPAVNGSLHGRTFAKLLGNGLTTTNLTDPLEVPCLQELTEQEEPDKAKLGGHWHQATNALRLILCNRSDPACKATSDNVVFFAVVHRKYHNVLKLPLRYERFFMVWSASPPFGVLGVSHFPISMANETARGWSESQNWDNDPANAAIVAATKEQNPLNSTEPYGGNSYWAYFTYTVSISYAYGREPRKGSKGDESEDMHVGYLDDEVVLAIGVDDAGQVFSRVKTRDLVSCLKACPGRGENRREMEDSR